MDPIVQFSALGGAIIAYLYLCMTFYVCREIGVAVLIGGAVFVVLYSFFKIIQAIGSAFSRTDRR